MKRLPMSFSNYLLFTAIFLVSGCGELLQDDNDSFLVSEASASESRKLHVKLKKVASGHSLYISAPSNFSGLRYCRPEEGSCSSWENADVYSGATASSRKVFRITSFDPSAGNLRLAKTDEGANGVQRTISFAKAPQGNGTPTNGAWKSVFMASDYIHHDGRPIVAWDNGRRDLASLFEQRGFLQQNIRHLSQDPAIQRSEKTGPGTKQGLEQALQSLNVGQNDKCLVFMTAHGSRSEFVVAGGQNIRPEEFDAMLTRHCGNRPTVALVSACFSGIFANAAARKSHRIIFTAASANKTSKGCVPGIKYNLFEQCLIDTLPRVETFNEWAQAIKPCMEREDRSDPIFFIGDQMQNLNIGGLRN